MEKRTISIALLVAIVSYFSARQLFRAHDFALGLLADNPDNALWPFLVLFRQLIQALPWLLPGIVAGYLCAKNPIKNGATTGAIFGAAVGIIGILMSANEPADASKLIHQISYTISHSLRCAFLFAISASAGNLLKNYRRAL